jgi:predicted helicase
MTDQNEAKTKTIGYLPLEKLQALRGWDEYLDKSTKLSILRAEAQKAKNCVRDALKERLNENGEIDFVGEGDRIRVFRVFRKQQQGRRTRLVDLSAAFREQAPERTTETNGQSAANVGDAIDSETTNLNTTTDATAASLDPVTERLMAIMREKGQR